MRGHTIQKSKMAQSAVAPSTATQRPHVNPAVKLTSGISPYKELSLIGYEKEGEEKGRDGFEPAKVNNILFIANLMPCDGIRDHFFTSDVI